MQLYALKLQVNVTNVIRTTVFWNDKKFKQFEAQLLRGDFVFALCDKKSKFTFGD